MCLCAGGASYNLKSFKIWASCDESPSGSPWSTQQPTILLLRDGTDSMEGIGQIISNINAIEAVVDIVKSTLGTCEVTQALEEWIR